MNSGDSSKGDGTHPEKKPDYFVRMVPGFVPGQADVAQAYLQYLPESLKTEYILALAELNSLDSRSITADAKTAMIASLHCAQSLDELAIALNRVERRLVEIDKQNQACHDEYLTCRSYIKRLRQYSTANKVVNTLHPDFAPDSSIGIAWYKKILYRLLAASWWVTVIDHVNVFVLLLPRTWRYKFYDGVTFAFSEVFPEKRI